MPLWPVAVYFAGVLAVVGAMLGVPRLLGERHCERATGIPYESGAPPTATARTRIVPHYYLVAMLFLIFDLEAVFLFAWAVAARELGWQGFFLASLFAAVLLLTLAYPWRDGALDWGTKPLRPAAARAQRQQWTDTLSKAGRHQGMTK